MTALARASSNDAPPVLDVRNLSIGFNSGRRSTVVVDDVSFSIERGEIFGLLGESGSGKSLTALSIPGLLPGHNCRITQGSVFFKGRDISRLPSREQRLIRGSLISMIFQEPMTSLNPTLTIGNQISEAIGAHREGSRKGVREKAIDMLESVGMAMPEHRMKQYPHELSGGLRQRVMIAMALSCSPQLLIADEPTTALDVTIQAQILQLLRKLQRESMLSMLLITHDIAVVSGMADRVAVMYAGRIVEEGPVCEVIDNPLHPYTQALIAAVPPMEQRIERLPVVAEAAIPAHAEPGCQFASRCEYSRSVCRSRKVDLAPTASSRHTVACIRWSEIHRSKPRYERSQPGFRGLSTHE